MGAPIGLIEMCLDGAARLGEQLIDSGPVAHWPLDDTFGSDVADVVGGFTGTSDNVSRGDPGMLPEYGCATGFNGTDSTIYVEHAALLAPTTNTAVAFVIKLGASSIPNQQTIIRKENGGSGGRIIVYLSTTPAIRFGVNIAGTYREVSYTIPSVADWFANPRLIVCRYTGSALEIRQVTNAGVVSVLVTAAWSGAVATGTGSRIYIGSNAATNEFFNGRLQRMTWYGNNHPAEADVDAMAASLVWTAITDVHAEDGIDAEWGIRNSGPEERLGDPGMLNFSLQNWAKGARPIGYYSTDHANCRTGFAKGCMVRYSLTDPNGSVVYRRFVGKLDEIEPETGQYHNAVVRCQVTDYFDELLSANLPTMPIVDSYVTGDIIARILQYVDVKPHQVNALGAGVETFDYGFDGSEDDDVVLREFGALADSERAGGIFMRGGAATAGTGGIFSFDAQDARSALTTPSWTFTNTAVALEVGQKRAERINTVRVTVYPRTPDVSDTVVLWAIDEPILLLPSEVINIHCPFEDADGEPVGATDFQNPLDDGVDYIAYLNADGSGGDVTNRLAIVMTAGASGADLEITNISGAGGAWITTLQIRGRPIALGKPITSTAVDLSLRKKFGPSVLDVDMPYQDSALAGQVAADELLAIWSQERTMARSMTLRVGQNSDATKTTAAIVGDCGDLIAITETQTGLSAEEYFIHGVRTHLANGGMLETTFTLQARE